MIIKIQYYTYQCDNCKNKRKFYNGIQNHNKTARQTGWAVSRNLKNCYCPKCAPIFRNSGRKTEKTINIQKEREKKNEI